MVDYSAVAALKWPLFEVLYQHFRERHLERPEASERARAFRAFQASGGEALRRFALHEALQEKFNKDAWGWPVWPEDYRDPQSQAVQDFAESAAGRERIEFYQYLQWKAQVQLDAAARLARRLGLAVGADRRAARRV